MLYWEISFTKCLYLLSKIFKKYFCCSCQLLFTCIYCSQRILVKSEATSKLWVNFDARSSSGAAIAWIMNLFWVLLQVLFSCRMVLKCSPFITREIKAIVQLVKPAFLFWKVCPGFHHSFKTSEVLEVFSSFWSVIEGSSYRKPFVYFQWSG